MTPLQKAAIFCVLILSLLLVWIGNRKLQQWIQPRRSFARLMLYLLSALLMVFVGTFGVVVLISKLFPLSNR